ncbi:hypothetical protein VNO77_42083 [Canavalia gladiata]|uniref:Uncharacterized protein n=1 Tax=Canavalia gladiata TaxID=3824 RepID=A0AAN9K236_CANGL
MIRIVTSTCSTEKEILGGEFWIFENKKKDSRLGGERRSFSDSLNLGRLGGCNSVGEVGRQLRSKKENLGDRRGSRFFRLFRIEAKTSRIHPGSTETYLTRFVEEISTFVQCDCGVDLNVGHANLLEERIKRTNYRSTLHIQRSKLLHRWIPPLLQQIFPRFQLLPLSRWFSLLQKVKIRNSVTAKGAIEAPTKWNIELNGVVFQGLLHTPPPTSWPHPSASPSTGSTTPSLSRTLAFHDGITCWEYVYIQDQSVATTLRLGRPLKHTKPNFVSKLPKTISSICVDECLRTHMLFTTNYLHERVEYVARDLARIRLIASGTPTIILPFKAMQTIAFGAKDLFRLEARQNQ